jgi:cytochrome P450
LLVGSANRDARHFDDPDRFDLHRRGRTQLAFGRGMHFCIGAALGQIEAEVVLSRLAALPDLRSEPGGRVWHANPATRALQALPVRFRVGSGASSIATARARGHAVLTPPCGGCPADRAPRA